MRLGCATAALVLAACSAPVESLDRAGGPRLTRDGRLAWLRVLDPCAGTAQIWLADARGERALADLRIDTQCAGHQYEPPALLLDDDVLAWASERPPSGAYALLTCP